MKHHQISSNTCEILSNTCENPSNTCEKNMWTKTRLTDEFFCTYSLFSLFSICFPPSLHRRAEGDREGDKRSLPVTQTPHPDCPMKLISIYLLILFITLLPDVSLVSTLLNFLVHFFVHFFVHFSYIFLTFFVQHSYIFLHLFYCFHHYCFPLSQALSGPMARPILSQCGNIFVAGNKI